MQSGVYVKRECAENVTGMKKWKTAIIGCYDVLGGNQKDSIFRKGLRKGFLTLLPYLMIFNQLQSRLSL